MYCGGMTEQSTTSPRPATSCRSVCLPAWQCDWLFMTWPQVSLPPHFGQNRMLRQLSCISLRNPDWNESGHEVDAPIAYCLDTLSDPWYLPGSIMVLHPACCLYNRQTCAASREPGVNLALLHVPRAAAHG